MWNQFLQYLEYKKPPFPQFSGFEIVDFIEFCKFSRAENHTGQDPCPVKLSKRRSFRLQTHKHWFHVKSD